MMMVMMVMVMMVVVEMVAHIRVAQHACRRTEIVSVQSHCGRPECCSPNFCNNRCRAPEVQALLVAQRLEGQADGFLAKLEPQRKTSSQLPLDSGYGCAERYFSKMHLPQN